MKRAFRLERERKRHKDVRDEEHQNGDHDYLSRFNQSLKIVEIPVDPTRDCAAEARGQLQGNGCALVGARHERNNARGEMIRSAMVGKSSPGESSLRNAQHDLKCRFMLLSVKCQRRGKMVRVQFPHPFDRSDEFWIILKHQPAFVHISDPRLDHD